MALVASVVERKKAESNENTFAVRPPMRQRFPVPAVKEIMRLVLADKLAEAKYSPDLTKDVADTIRAKVKDLGLARYKFVVHVVVGEQRGEGVRIGTRCLWDATTDAMATETFRNEAIFAVATTYGVYLY